MRSIERSAGRWPWWVAAAVTGALAAGCAPSAPVQGPGRRGPTLPDTVRVGRLDGSARVRTLPLETYVLATTLSEIAPPASDSATAMRLFEVQAIVARTYVAANLGRHASEGYDVCDSTHCQVVDLDRLARSPWCEVASEAVASTAGLILLYRGQPAETLFHADCGGHTSAADDVWGGEPVPYLRALTDNIGGRAIHQTWQFDAPERGIVGALSRRGVPVGSAIRALGVTARDPAGRVQQLSISGNEIASMSGEAFRAAVNGVYGAMALRSTWFDVSRRGTAFHFEGHGFGHGVGLCQVGAMARARAGETPRAILAFYYPGTELGPGAPVRTSPAIPHLRPRRTGQTGR
jgi:stage II sporulation protein D